MDEDRSTEFVPKKHLTKGQAITVMVIGGLMILFSIVFPAKQPSTTFTIKVIVGMLGFIVVCVGSALRPGKSPRNPKE